MACRAPAVGAGAGPCSGEHRTPAAARAEAVEVAGGGGGGGGAGGGGGGGGGGGRGYVGLDGELHVAGIPLRRRRPVLQAVIITVNLLRLLLRLRRRRLHAASFRSCATSLLHRLVANPLPFHARCEVLVGGVGEAVVVGVDVVVGVGAFEPVRRRLGGEEGVEAVGVLELNLLVLVRRVRLEPGVVVQLRRHRPHARGDGVWVKLYTPAGLIFSKCHVHGYG